MHSSAEFSTLRVDKSIFRTNEAIDMLISDEKAEALITQAGKLGGFSVEVIAKSGDPYRRVTTHEDGSETYGSTVEIPEGRVLVTAKNTGNPETPRDLSELHRAAASTE